MSGAEATLYGAILAGTFALLGVVTERVLRGTGRLRCVASEPSWLLQGIEEEEGYPRSAPLEQADASKVRLAQGVSYHFALDLFNGKEVPIGLRDTRVELVLDAGEEPLRSTPQDLTTTRSGRLYPGIPAVVGAGPDDLGVINLPPRQIVHKELHGEFGRDAAVALATGKWRKLQFAGELPARPFFGVLGSKAIRFVIAERN